MSNVVITPSTGERYPVVKLDPQREVNRLETERIDTGKPPVCLPESFFEVLEAKDNTNIRWMSKEEIKKIWPDKPGGGF